MVEIIAALIVLAILCKILGCIAWVIETILIAITIVVGIAAYSITAVVVVSTLAWKAIKSLEPKG